MTAPALADVVRDVLAARMRKDDRVLVVGEDVGELGGLFGATSGLLEEFGPGRVIDFDAGEEATLRVAVGAALAGRRTVVEIQSAEFSWGAADVLFEELGALRYRTEGDFECPLVVRIPVGGGVGGGASLSASPEAHWAGIPGVRVVCPSSVGDARVLFEAALRAGDPVVFLEPKELYGAVTSGDSRPASAGEAGGGEPGELGRARVLRAGDDVTLVSYGSMIPRGLDAAETLAAEGIDVEVVDLRSLSPLDEGTILASVRKTGRLVTLHESPRSLGIGSELAALAAEKALLRLEAPILRVAGFDTPVPHALESSYRPDAERVARAIREVAQF